MPFKFENLEVWQLSMEYIDLIYELAKKLHSFRKILKNPASGKLGEEPAMYLVDEEVEG